MEPTVETLERIAEKYKEEISMFNGKTGMSHFNHLIGTLGSLLNFTPWILSHNQSTWEEEKMIYRKTIRALRTYLNLLKEFPEFRDAELTNIYFPEIQSTLDQNLSAQGWKSGSYYYIHEANKRLRGKQ